MSLRRVHTWLSTVWAVVAVLTVRLRTRRLGVHARAPRYWRACGLAGHGIGWVLEGPIHATCLEQALVLQAWLQARSERRDVLVGVPVEGLGTREIHAWVDGDRRVPTLTYTIVHRLPPTRR